MGSDDYDFRLRAERRGSGNGRTYSVTYAAVDPSGNETRATSVAVVPHDARKGK